MGRRKKSEAPQVELRDEEVLRLRDALTSVADFREEKKPVYKLPDLITMLVYSTLCGNIGATGANRYCSANGDFFKRVFTMKSIPSVTTFSKIIPLLGKEQIAKYVEDWAVTCSDDIKILHAELVRIHEIERLEREEIERMEIELRDAEVDSLEKAVDKVPDFRFARGVRYPLKALIIMMIFSALCGYTKSEDIEFYCKSHANYFINKFGLKQTPSHDTFSRVMAFLNPKKLALPLIAWMKTCFPDLKTRFKDYLILHLDGKAIRAAANKQNGEEPRYLLNAMYEGESIGLIMKEVGRKRNESSEILDFLSFFNLAGTLVTADAAATTAPILTKIIESGGHYIVPIKGNQSKAEEAIIMMINYLLAEPAKNPGPGVTTMFDECDHIICKPKRQHGREEEYTCTLLDVNTTLGELLEEKPFLKTAAHVAVIDKRTTRIEKGEEVTSNSRRIFIVSLEDVTPADVRQIVAGHWHIEANHWVLDVQLREDSVTSRKKHSMEFGALLRRLSVAVWNYTKDDNSRKKTTYKQFLINNQASTSNIEEILNTCVTHSNIPTCMT